MGKLYCIMGKSASGKDTIFKRLTKEEGLKRIVPYTTRPRRSEEVEGRDYHFVSMAEYENMSASGKVIESREYHTVQGLWVYFTADDGQIELSGPGQDSIIIVTLKAFGELTEHFGRENIVPLYIELEDGIRLERAIKREREQEKPDYQELCRRFIADCEDFSEEKLEASGISPRFENTDLELCLEEIRKFIKSQSA